MKQRYRLFLRRGSVFYFVDTITGEQKSLGTKNRTEAERLIHVKNEAFRQPALNLQIARAYLAAGEPAVISRTWQGVIEAIIMFAMAVPLLNSKGSYLSNDPLRGPHDHPVKNAQPFK